MRLGVLFYHPKNHLNLHDAAYIAYSIDATLYVVPRPGTNYKLELLPEKVRSRIELINNIRDVVEKEKDSLFLVIETYGEKYIHELSLSHYDKVIIVIGAEDYGVPATFLSNLPRHIVARIPLSVEGMSYNVVSALVMAIYEIRRKS